MQIELETLMRGAFPNPGDDKKVRTLLANDVGKERLGVPVQDFNDEIQIAYPIAGER
jgi:hypothetical protein